MRDFSKNLKPLFNICILYFQVAVTLFTPYRRIYNLTKKNSKRIEFYNVLIYNSVVSVSLYV